MSHRIASVTLSGEGDRRLVKKIQVEKIGHAIMDTTGNNLLVHTGDAIKRFTLSNLAAPPDKFQPPALLGAHRPKVLGYIEDSRHVVVGTDFHEAVVIGLATGAVRDVLEFPQQRGVIQGVIQAVAGVMAGMIMLPLGQQL
ncbi:hypothetical protein AAF712_008655 [Marasmius tenuissimus]|uniref:Uncharacterized protein n=1 Tax=Marasmius tenuissimus TaxID=585030 RepID=A0ABR2ZSU3_9AGAR